ncbi:MAG: hypothetical protein AAGC96_03535 [Pseudomonadota bacterium]
MLRRIRRGIGWLFVLVVLLAIGLAIPVVYIESRCQDLPRENSYEPLLTEAQWQRDKSETFLDYPRNHVAYAQADLAKVLETGDEHEFDFTNSIVGYWTSFCEVNRLASQHGATELDDRIPLHVVGAGFTLDMVLKAAYEETLGRLLISNRGEDKTPQDLQAARVAEDQARFVRDAPWHAYDFDAAVDALWAEPLVQSMRGWERRLALGGEWATKSAVAGIVAGRTDDAANRPEPLHSVVTGLQSGQLSTLPDVTIAENHQHYAIIRTLDSRHFTGTLQAIADAGGRVLEIAGNDEIMVSLISPEPVPMATIAPHRVIAVLDRDGFDDKRVLVVVTIPELAAFMVKLNDSVVNMERVYAY